MRRTVNLTKGLNLELRGGVSATDAAAEVWPGRIAIAPADYPGFVPKPDVAEGDAVQAGTPLLHHKADPRIRIVSPCAGTVKAIVRGARRRIERVEVETSAAQWDATVTADTSAVAEALMASGLWVMMRQRPYDIVPDPSVAPRDIFVTAMDTAPLAVDPTVYLVGKEAELKAGVKALQTLTKGHIYIGVSTASQLPDIEGAEMVAFTPLHPAGNAGVQAANIAPVNKGEVIWTLDVATLARIGALMLSGSYSPAVNVAVTGGEVIKPQVVKTLPGAPVEELTRGNVADDGVHHRYIAGNVLTGIPVGKDGYLHFPYRQVTVIPEGDDRDEFMGWASMSPEKMSVSRSFLGKFLGRAFNPDARLNGGRRAMIMSEVYDRYMPMDIMPEYLIKAIEARDIDQMEALGIYEVAPEDFALAEYADPSKLELQRIVREGLDYLRSEV